MIRHIPIFKYFYTGNGLASSIFIFILLGLTINLKGMDTIETVEKPIPIPIIFNVFRVFVIPSEGQQVAQFNEVKTKEELLNSIFISLSESHKTKIGKKCTMFSFTANPASAEVFKFQL